jgi:excisionase family DNA binding protein
MCGRYVQITVYENLVSGDLLALRLGVSAKTVERWTRARVIPCYRFGKRCVRYDSSEVRHALRKFEQPALRRLPRGNYQSRRRPPKVRFEAQQLELPFQAEDQDQLQLGLTLFPVAPGSTLNLSEPAPDKEISKGAARNRTIRRPFQLPGLAGV